MISLQRMISAALLILLLGTSPAAQSVAFRKVILEGDPAPGMSGLLFNDLGTIDAFGELIALPAIDKQGNVAFSAMAGPDPLTISSPRGVWREVDGVLSLAMQAGDPAPGTAQNFFGFPVIGNTPFFASGKLTVFGGVPAPGGSLQRGLWSDRFGTLQLVLLDTDHLPGTPAGTQVFEFVPLLREKHIVINATFNDSFIQDEGLWRDSGAGFVPVAIEGAAAAGFPAGAVFGSSDAITFEHPIHFWTANERGDVVFNAYAQGGGVSTQGIDDEGIWFSDASTGTLNLVVRERTPAPAVGPLARFGSADGLDSFGNQDFTQADLPVGISDAGHVVFGASAWEPGYTRRPTVWTNRGGNLQLLMTGARDNGGTNPDGSAAPGYPSAASFLDFEGCFALMNGADEIALTANVAMGGSITRAIFWDHPGTLSLIARVDGPVPGLPGLTFQSLQLSTFSDAGVLWYSGVLSGPGVNQTNDFAAFMVRPDGTQHLALREGSTFDVRGDGTDLRTVATFGMGPGHTDAGERVFEVIFTNGTSGIFTARMPQILPPLFADEQAIPVSEGALVDFSLDAGPAFGGRSYRLVAGASGSAPGIFLPGGLIVPVHLDMITRRVLLHSNSGQLDHFHASLDASGAAVARLELPPAVASGLVGRTWTFAWLAESPFDFVSNAVSVVFVP